MNIPLLLAMVVLFYSKQEISAYFFLGLIGYLMDLVISWDRPHGQKYMELNILEA